MIVSPESLLKYSAIELSRALHSRQVTAVDLMHETLHRIDAINPQINAVVSLEQNRDRLMEEARRADEILDGIAAAVNNNDASDDYSFISSSKNNDWLRGIPMAIKDLEDAQGFPTTKGCPIYGTYNVESTSWHFDNQTEDAPYVHRLRKAGAIIIGKTNTPELGAGCHSYNLIFGTTVNPMDMSKAAGGSSGGAGAALASYMFCALDGSDMMGSLRNPAGWNSLYSLRPTVEWMEEEQVVDDELVDNYADDHNVKMPWPMSTIGPIGRCPEDLALMLQTMIPAGRAELFDAASILDQSSEQLSQIVKGKTVGWLADWGGEYPMEAGVLQQCRESLDIFTKGNVDIECVATPLFSSKELWDAWITIRSHLIFNSLHEQIGGDRCDVLQTLKERGVKAEVIYECERGIKLTKEQIHDRLRTVQAWSTCAENEFGRYDFLALPSSQTYPFDASLDWPKTIAGTKMDTYHRWMEVMVPVTVAGLPCVTIPAGIGSRGLPIGVQIFGPKGSDAKLLQLAYWYSRYCKGDYL
eukprot:scaffold14002_cov83-Skeletonema_dohrnii-CCMP3373.AAC.4